MPEASDIAKAKRILADHRLARPLVLGALPAHDAPPLAARQIAETVELCTTMTARRILNALVVLGIATVDIEPCPRGQNRNVYRRSGDTDNWEDSPTVYAVEETEGV